MAITITAHILIDRSPLDLFLFVAHFENEPRWNPLVARVVKVSEGPVGRGTLWRGRLAIPVIKLTQLRRVIAYVPGRAIVFENASGFPVQVGYRFVPKGKGKGKGEGNSTLLIASSSIRLVGPYKILGPLVHPVVRLMTMILLRRLKKVVEAGVLPGTGP